jgi:hypothetical protein
MGMVRDARRLDGVTGAAPTSTNSSFRTGVPSSTVSNDDGIRGGGAAGATSIGTVEASQQARISVP